LANNESTRAAASQNRARRSMGTTKGEDSMDGHPEKDRMNNGFFFFDKGI
jgi:hypothetical protein